MKNFLTSRKFTLIATFVGLFLISTGISFAAFNFVGGGGGLSNISESLSGLAKTRSKISLDLPKTEECPINGKMYTKVERDIWEARRPITAVIENHVDARPIEGIIKADVVHEAVAEGGITRFLGVFYCGVSAEDTRLAPVRSARVHFIKWAAGYADYPIFLHIGGANNFCPDCPGGVKPRGDIAPEVNAYQLLADLEWYGGRNGNDFDGERAVGYPVVWRDPERLGKQIASEHTVVASSDNVFDEAARRGFKAEYEGVAWDANYEPWAFINDTPAASADAKDISFKFWDGKEDYDVKWEYNSTNNSYMRFNGTEKFVDLQSKQQIEAKNIAVIFVKERGPVDREYHMYYEPVGKGDAMIFQNGTVIDGTWEKGKITDNIMFYDSKGDPVSFVRGQIWIEALPIGNDIEIN